MPSVKRWVVKAGSQMVCSGGPLLVRAWMKQVDELRRKHRVEVIWVTSGAIATAVDRTRFRRKNRTLPEKQALSAIGQPAVMDLYNLALSQTGQLGAQVLLTADDLSHAKRRGNLTRTLKTLLKWNVVPVLNENDATATEEIQFGDNDMLSAKVAHAMKAHRLVILTDVDGFYLEDPRKNLKAKVVHELKGVSQKTLARAGGSTSGRGTGGMASKLLAARDALHHGIETWLVRGDHHDILLKIASQSDPSRAKVGTRIFA